MRKRILAITIAVFALLAVVVPNAEAAKAKKFVNSSSSKYSVAVFSGANCTGTRRYLARGASLSEWVQSYRVGSTRATATYGGTTYNRSYGVCYYTSYRGTVTYWNGD